MKEKQVPKQINYDNIGDIINIRKIITALHCVIIRGVVGHKHGVAGTD